MPEIASCASGRHQPPVESASSPKVTAPPSFGLAVSTNSPGIGPLPPTLASPVWFAPPPGLVVPVPPPLPLLPQAPRTNAIASSAATAPPDLRLRDPRTCATYSPNSHGAGSPTGRARDAECDRCHSGWYRRNLRNQRRPCQSLSLVALAAGRGIRPADAHRSGPLATRLGRFAHRILRLRDDMPRDLARIHDRGGRHQVARFILTSPMGPRALRGRRFTARPTSSVASASAQRSRSRTCA